VSGGTCSLQPITRKAAGKIQVRIIAGDEALALAANLAPQGDGTLKGDVFVLEGLSTPGTPAPTPAPGQLVRLDDSRWPDSARMLIVGEIESVSPSPEQLLRQVIVVRPLADVTRVSEVLLRIAGREEAPR
jgi:hypothetical protein